jgi:hypothetical protein
MSVEFPGRAFTHLGERVAHLVERTQAEQDRQRVDGNHAGAEHREIGIELSLELADLLLEFAAIAHHAEAGDPVLRVEDEIVFQNVYALAAGTGRLVAALEFLVERHVRNRRSRDRTGHRGRTEAATESGRHRFDGPVPTGFGLGEFEVVELRRTPQATVLGNADGSDDAIEMSR